MALNKQQYDSIMEEYELNSDSPLSQYPNEIFQNIESITTVLLNVPAFDYSFSPYRGTPHVRRPPIGLFAIKAATEYFSGKPLIHIIDMEEFRLAPIDAAFIISEIQKRINKKLIVGINGYSPNRYLIEKIINRIDTFTNELKIILGGRLVSIELDPRSRNYISRQDSIINSIKSKNDIYFFVGEAESIFIQLLENAKWDDLNIESLGKKSKNCLVYPQKFEVLKKDILEFGTKQLPPKYYATEGQGHYYFALISSRSCAFDCTFCAANYFPVRIRDIEQLQHQIESLCVLNNGEIYIDFFDDNVFQNARRGTQIIEMMERIYDNGYKVIWRALARADTLMKIDSTGHINRASKVGLEEVAIGLESVSDNILQDMSKRMNFNTIDSSISQLQNNKIRAKMFAMIGSKNETISDAQKTIEYLKMKSKYGHRWSLFIQAPYAGTEDHKGFLNQGYSYWDLQLYTEAASRGGELITAVDKYDIKLSNLRLSELFSIAQEGNDIIFNASLENLGEDCCAVSFENQDTLNK